MESDKILAKTALKPTAPEFVPSAVKKIEVMPLDDLKKPMTRPEVPPTVPESPEDSDDEVRVILRISPTPEVDLHQVSVQRRDTVASIASTDSEMSAISDCQRDKDDTAHLGDLSDSGSETGASPADEEKSQVKTEQETPLPATADDDLPPFVPPDDELAKRIVDQVEFYFSDVNITKDAFLLKHVKRNKEGYVSLKLISSFKRVKHIARDWRVVAYALRNSSKLEINEAGTKLRRVDPLPAYDQTTPSRTVVAINLPQDKPTIESVAELFRSCGDIALVRILRPGNPIPADVRAFVSKHPEMHGVVSALVEFVRTEAAMAAVAKRDWDKSIAGANAMRVLELNAPASPQAADRIKKKNAANKKNILGKFAYVDYDCQSGSDAEIEHRIIRNMQRRGSSPMDCGKHWLQRRYSRDSGCEDMGYQRTSSSGSLYGRASPWDSGSEFSRSRSNSGASFDPNVRRMSAGWDSGSESCCSGRSSRSNSGAFIMDGLTRRFSVGKDSDSDGYGSFRSRKSSGGSDLSRRLSSDSVGGCGHVLRRNGSLAGMHHDEELFVPARRGSHQIHLEHQLARRMTAMGLSDHQECCSCHCSRPIPPQDILVRRGSGELQRKPGFGHAPTMAQVDPTRRSSGAGVPDNVMRMPRGPDGGRGFLAPNRENDIPEVC